jgi:hypothetical protein
MRSMSFIGLLAALVFAATVPACSSTQLVAAWRDPTVSRVRFNRVIAIAPHSDPAIRRSIEEKLAQELRPGTEVVPSYRLFPEEQLHDQQALYKRIGELGFDGAVVFRIVAVEREQVWVPGMYQGSFYAYGGWPIYSPGYVSTTNIVRVDTNIYSVTDQKLVWASTSRTFEPRTVDKLVEKVVKKVAKEMRKEGLVIDA